MTETGKETKTRILRSDGTALENVLSVTISASSNNINIHMVATYPLLSAVADSNGITIMVDDKAKVNEGVTL